MSALAMHRLIAQAKRMDECPAQVSLFEQAVRIADSIGDEETAYDTRVSLVRSATFSGMAEKALPAFSWCLAFMDRRADEFAIAEYLLEAGQEKIRSDKDIPISNRQQIHSQCI